MKASTPKQQVKQSVWRADGSFEGFYDYPPGKRSEKIRSELNLDWLSNSSGTNRWRSEESFYWDKPSKSPVYVGSIGFFRLQDYMPVTFYFSNDRERLYKKYQAVKYELSTSIKTENELEIGDECFRFQGDEENPFGICFIQGNMILKLEAKLQNSVEKAAKAICETYAKHRNSKNNDM